MKDEHFRRDIEYPKDEQFHSMYTQYRIRCVIVDCTKRAVYKHWNNWCFRGGRGLYCFEKGYDEDYAKYNL